MYAQQAAAPLRDAYGSGSGVRDAQRDAPRGGGGGSGNGAGARVAQQAQQQPPLELSSSYDGGRYDPRYAAQQAQQTGGGSAHGGRGEGSGRRY